MLQLDNKRLLELNLQIANNYRLISSKQKTRDSSDEFKNCGKSVIEK